MAEMNSASIIPVIELNGRILTQSYAILRHFARQLKAYEGETEDGKYWVDAICDIIIDCMLFSGVRKRVTKQTRALPLHPSLLL